MLSLVLNAVQVRFGGILGKFPNIVMLQHGEPGDGKSIALWLVLQVLYYFHTIKTEHDAAKHRMDLRRKKQSELSKQQVQPMTPRSRSQLHQLSLKSEIPFRTKELFMDTWTAFGFLAP